MKRAIQDETSDADKKMTIQFPIKQVTNIIFLTLVIVVGLSVTPSVAIEPDEILVIANKNVARSVELAQYYMEKRNVPDSNLLQLRVSDKEVCTRDEYNKKVAPEVLRRLEQTAQTRRIRCLVTMYGLPLKISAPKMTPDEKKQVAELKKRQKTIKDRLKTFSEQEGEEISNLKQESKTIEKRISVLNKADQRSSLDSELAVVLEKDYSLSGWIPNPYFIGFKDKKLSIAKENILMVSRLDGPSAHSVKRIIQDSIQAEKNGLSGIAYFDARWQASPKKELSGYAYFDNSIHRAADLIRKSRLMPVVIDDTSELFKSGEGQNAALYCGWYSLAKYVDAFIWKQGAVGYHIASSECSTLKNKNSRVWCKMMLEKGVAATIGPVWEPYVQAFPIPEVFFGFLVDGYLSLAECYLISTPFFSWQMVLIGDPLYRPFKNVKLKK